VSIAAAASCAGLLRFANGAASEPAFVHIAGIADVARAQARRPETTAGCREKRSTGRAAARPWLDRPSGARR